MTDGNGSHSFSAVGYLRRSSSKQEKSIVEQRREIERYAAQHGYHIVRWYTDDSISGDATERRPGFLQMREDACQSRDFDTILVWDMDRFGRFDLLEAGHWIQPLRKAGVRLETVTEGPVDWENFTGRLMYGIKTEGKHQYLRDLSRNVTRGHISNALGGYSCGQRPPYGYDRMLFDESGEPKQRIKAGEKYGKPRGWRVRWVLSEDPLVIRTVLWLFETYATTDIGYRALASQLNERGIAGPTGGKWFDTTVRALLENEAYIGTFVWNKRRHGKYHRIVNGEIVERDRSEIHLMPCGKPNARNNPPELWMVVENAHESLIDREMFAAVQAKMARRKRSSGCGYQTHTNRKDRADYLLTGLLFCEHCGRKMHGTMYRRRKNGKVYEYQRYICSSYTRGDRKCGHHAIRQDVILNAVMNKVRTDVLLGDRDRLRTALREKLTARQQPDTEQLQRLKRRLGELDKQIDTGAERVLTAPETLLDVLTTKLQQMKREREQVAAELHAIQQAAKPADLEAEVDRIATKAWSLLEELEQADPARLRELLHRAVERIDLRFEARQHGKKRQYHPTGGQVVFRELSGFAGRGDKTAIELFRRGVIGSSTQLSLACQALTTIPS